MAGRKGEVLLVVYRQEGLGHTQVGHISETVLEGGTGRVQPGQRIKGYFFINEIGFFARVLRAPRRCDPVQTRVRFCIN